MTQNKERPGRRVQIAPSLLAADFGRLAEEAQQAEAGGADLLHLDVMDGHFVPNITLGPAVVAAVRRATRLPLDLHLMVDDPRRFFPAFRDAGADAVTVHWEATPHIEGALHQLHELGLLAGVAINPATPVAVLDDIWDELDWLLIMSVNPGFGGQEFWPRALHKIEQAASRRGDRDRPRIAVDGGIDETTASLAAAAGADVVVAGTAVFGHGDPAAGIKSLRERLTVPTGTP